MQRKANFEVLRIISMMMIVTLHFFSHGMGGAQIAHGTITYYIMQSVVAIAQVGVNCFVLLSSYFMIDKSFKLSRVIRIAINVFFYSILCLCIFVLCSGEQIGIKEIVYSFFPIISSQYWFITQYVLLLFISPILNRAIATMTETVLHRATLIFVILFSLIPTILPWSKYNLSTGKNIIWFVTLYLIAGCIKKYSGKEVFKYPLVLFFLSAAITVVVDEFLAYMAAELESGSSTFLYYNNSPSVMFGAVMLIVWVKKLEVNPKLSKYIVGFSEGVFGVYLFHDNPLIRKMMWQKLSGMFITEEWALIINLLISLVLIFLVGWCIEFIRNKIFRWTKVNDGITWFANLITERFLPDD